MPGWYIHIEAAKQAVNRLRAGDISPDFPKMGFPTSADRAKQLGAVAYKWRNYLAWGAIGPDIFYLLPDFRPSKLFPNLPNDLMSIVNWVLREWDQLDKQFIGPWDSYAAPAVRGVGDILNQMSGGVIREIGEALKELSKAYQDLILDLVAHLWDWFGIFSSGVPDGLSENEFFWSDIFHYRKTYKFARALWINARTEQEMAFALGWMTHCATDVTGHPFVNQKVGGPWRLHWQRHHLVENHMDAKVYDTQHNGVEPYGELDTSCLHFFLAFRQRNDGDYATPDGAGVNDGPAYDYFAGFPMYDGHNPLSGLDTSDSGAGDNNRAQFFDMDVGLDAAGGSGFSDDFCNFLIKTIRDVHADPDPANTPPLAPQILKCTDAQFHDDDSGRPSPLSLRNTAWILFEYVKSTSSSGYSPPVPMPPPVFNDHSPPAFPQPSEDKARGDDPQNEPTTLLDVLFAIFGFLLWLGEFAVWLITLPEAVVADLLTYPARELLYLIAVQPLYSLYLLTRQPLVMSGFLHPKHNEISAGLVELGVSSSAPFADLVSALASAGAVWPQSPPTSEPSGRASATGPASEVDGAYPRAIIQDNPTLIAQAVSYVASFLGAPDIPFCFQKTQPSEFLRPWRYPAANNAGEADGGERAASHSGPWVQGQSAEVLMNMSPGDASTRKDFEHAKNPEECEGFCEKHFPAGQHLGDPVDYSVYLIGALTNTAPGASIPPDFNLDSDRGYAYHCWDWDRSSTLHHPQSCPAFSPKPDFTFAEPCTVPEGFCNPDYTKSNPDPGPHYDPSTPLSIHFEEQPNPQCIILEQKPKLKP